MALKGFQEGFYRVLVATDVAARGIHVDGIAHVVNFDLPQAADDFIHRVGRTGRAGAEGVATTFATSAERGDIRNIERIAEAETDEERTSGGYRTGSEERGSCDRNAAARRRAEARRGRRIRWRILQKFQGQHHRFVPAEKAPVRHGPLTLVNTYEKTEPTAPAVGSVFSEGCFFQRRPLIQAVESAI